MVGHGRLRDPGRPRLGLGSTASRTSMRSSNLPSTRPGVSGGKEAIEPRLEPACEPAAHSRLVAAGPAGDGPDAALLAQVLPANLGLGDGRATKQLAPLQDDTHGLWWSDWSGHSPLCESALAPGSSWPTQVVALGEPGAPPDRRFASAPAARNYRPSRGSCRASVAIPKGWLKCLS